MFGDARTEGGRVAEQVRLLRQPLERDITEVVRARKVPYSELEVRILAASLGVILYQATWGAETDPKVVDQAYLRVKKTLIGEYGAQKTVLRMSKDAEVDFNGRIAHMIDTRYSVFQKAMDGDMKNFRLMPDSRGHFSSIANAASRVLIVSTDEETHNLLAERLRHRMRSYISMSTRHFQETT